MHTAITEATSEQTGAVGSEKTTYRRYVKLGTVTEGDTTKTVIKEQRVAQETAAKDKDSGQPRAWAEAEKEGLVLFNENTATSYTIKALEGFEMLVPDPEQRLYIINTGLNNVQTAKIQSFMKANEENATEPTPSFNQVDLDLRVGIGEDGEYSIQKAPQRRSLSDREKLDRLLTAMGKTEEQKQAILTAYDMGALG